MVLRSDRLEDACGKEFCAPAVTEMDGYSTDQEYYDNVSSEYLIWWAMHRDVVVAKDILAKAFVRYPSSNADIQTLVVNAAGASRGQVAKIHQALRKHRKDNPDDNKSFVLAAILYTKWILGSCKDGSTSLLVATTFLNHVGNTVEFGQWLRTELTFAACFEGVS